VSGSRSTSTETSVILSERREQYCTHCVQCGVFYPVNGVVQCQRREQCEASVDCTRHSVCSWRSPFPPLSAWRRRARPARLN
jgi:hypothetical protein